MKVFLALLVIGVALSQCDALELKQHLDKIRDEWSAKGDAIKKQLGEVVPVLKDQAVDGFKSLLSNTLQATIGAILTAFKGFDPAKILGFGKRDFGDHQEFMRKLIDEAGQAFKKVFDKTFAKFSAVFESLAQMKPVEDVQSRFAQINAEHNVAVRGILGDALNTGIDMIKKLYYKAKALLTGDKQETADPIMVVGRRGLLDDSWNIFSSKVSSLKNAALSHYYRASEISNNVAASLSHYAGKMMEQVKDKAIAKVHQTLAELGSHLRQRIDSDRSAFESVKQELADTIHKVLN